MANEKRLIDANAVEAKIEKSFRRLIANQNKPDLAAALSYVGDLIIEAPTVDAVEVVFCKGCKHWLHVEEGFGDCTNPRFHLDGHADPTMNADDFCSCGERRENNA